MIANHFIISHCGEVEAKHNTVNNVFNFYKDYRKLCSFIYVRYGDNKYLFKTPTMASGNFDPTKGRLYVTYQAVVETHELGGQTITAAGFASSDFADLIVNTAEFSIKKKQGEPLLISGTMVLNFESGGQKLLGGDNRLVRMLLGTESFSPSAFRVSYGTKNTPQESYVYSQSTSYSVVPVFTSEEISFPYQPISTGATDLVLLCDMQPVLRVMAPMELTVKSANYASLRNSEFTLTVDSKFVSLDEFSLNLVKVSNHSTSLIPSGLTYYAKAGLKLPVGGRIVSDPKSKYFAYINNGRATLLRINRTEVSVVKWHFVKDIMLTTDGAVFLIGTDNSVTHILNGVSTKLSFAAGEKYAVAEKNGRYVFGTHASANAKVYFYMFNVGGSMTTASVNSLANAQDVLVLALHDAVFTVEKGLTTAAYLPTGADSTRKNWLNYISKKEWFDDTSTVYYDTGKLLYYDGYYDQTVYNFDSNSVMYTNPVHGKLYGNFNVRNKGYAAEISKRDELLLKLATVDGTVIHAAVIGLFLYLFMQDGSILVYVIEFNSICISQYQISSVSIITCKTSSVAPCTDKIAIKIKRR